MATMTKARKRAPGAGRKKGPNPPRIMIASFKGTPDFDRWLRALIADRRLPKSVLIEHALIDYARAHGFEDPAPER